jgi:hypothetical protein
MLSNTSYEEILFHVRFSNKLQQQELKMENIHFLEDLALKTDILTYYCH